MTAPILTVFVSVDGLRPLTANKHKRLPGIEAAKIVRRWRDTAAEAWLRSAEVRGVDALAGPLTIEAQPHLSDGQYVPDVGAHAPTLKAIIDGLREPTEQEAARGIIGAGLIPDDTPDYIGRIVWLPAVHHSKMGHGLSVKVYRTYTVHPDGDDPDYIGTVAASTEAEHGPGESLTPGKLGAADAVPVDYFDGDDIDGEGSGPGTAPLDDPAEAWATLRDEALHATDMAWQWAIGHAARVSMRNLAKITGIKRPTLIRWMNWSHDDKSIAHDPASMLLKMLHPDEYKRQDDTGEQGNLERYRAPVRNGGPWPITDSDPPAFTIVVNGRWAWFDADGWTAGAATTMANYDDAKRYHGYRFDDQAAAETQYWHGHVAGEDRGEQADDEPF